MALIVPHTAISEADERYDGSQLRAHWIYDRFGIAGDAAVAFFGAADVRGESLVDLADRRDGLFIASDRMLHVIVERFGPGLERAVVTQRLLVHLTRELLADHGVTGLRRSGDDLFVGAGKLSVSIATVSGVSSLVHLGINVVASGAPVPVAALAALDLKERPFAAELLERFRDEIAAMAHAATKVRAVR